MSKVYLNSLEGWKVMNSLGKEGERLAKEFLKKKDIASCRNIIAHLLGK
jgi:hypothetical protein